MIEILIAIIILIVLGLALTGRGRTMIKGFVNLFFEDVSKTPKGADAIYSEAIEEAKKDYVKADNNLRKITGMLETAKLNKETAANNVAKFEKQAETLAKQQRFEEIEDVIMPELEIAKEELLVYDKQVKEYEPMQKQAKEVHAAIELKLKKLEKERKVVVRKLELNEQTKEMYDSLDELKNVKNTDKLLKSVKEGALSSEEEVRGAKAVYENRSSTKMAKINAEVKSAESSAYVEELRRKYGNK